MAEFDQRLRWLPLDRASEDHVDLPIDRVVMRLLLRKP